MRAQMGLAARTWDIVSSKQWVSSCLCDPRVRVEVIIAFANGSTFNYTIIDLRPLLQAGSCHQPPVKVDPYRPAPLFSPEPLALVPPTSPR